MNRQPFLQRGARWPLIALVVWGAIGSVTAWVYGKPVQLYPILFLAATPALIELALMRSERSEAFQNAMSLSANLFAYSLFRDWVKNGSVSTIDVGVGLIVYSLGFLCMYAWFTRKTAPQS